MGKNLKKQVTLRMSADEIALLERLAKDHGGKGAAMVAGLKALDRRNAPSPGEALEIVRRALERAAPR